MELLFFGNQNRTQEATGANETSSRSHAVLQITVEEKDKAEGTCSEINIGKLSLIDLAGSERASKTNNRGLRMIEGANINRSLLALGNCINALVDTQKSGRKNHIPYRDSKLTRLLKDSLGGNCRTVMIANISPSNLSYEDTHNTLKYANRAKNIKTSNTKNVHTVDYHISKYTQIIKNLQNEISILRTQVNTRGGALPAIQEEMSQTIGSSQLEEMQSRLAKHFESETKSRKYISEIEQKLILMKTSSSLNANERMSKEFELKLKNEKQQLSLMERERETIQDSWKDANLFPSAVKMLELQMKQHVSMEREITKAREDLNLQAREQAMDHMEEQLKIRDDLLNTATEVIKKNNLDCDLNHPEMLELEEIKKKQACTLPPIVRSTSQGYRQMKENKGHRNSFDATDRPRERDIEYLKKKYDIDKLQNRAKHTSIPSSSGLPPVQIQNRSNFQISQRNKPSHTGQKMTNLTFDHGSDKFKNQNMRH